MPGLAAFLFLGLHLRQLRRLHAELEEILHFNPLRTVHRPAAIHSAEFGHLALDLLLGLHLSLQEVLQQRERQSRRGQDLGWALDLRRLRRLRRRRGRGHRGWHRAPRQGPQHTAQPRADLCHGGRHRSEKDLMPSFVGTRLRAALAVGEHINACASKRLPPSPSVPALSTETANKPLALCPAQLPRKLCPPT